MPYHDALRQLAVAKVIFYVMAGSYLFSAGLLLLAAARGERVAAWFVAGWVVTGLTGAALTAALGPGRVAVWCGLLIAMTPWMVLSLVVDARHGYWAIVALDVAGLGAIAYAARLSFAGVAGAGS